MTGPAVEASGRIDVAPGWMTLLDAVLDHPGNGRVGVIGPTGSGKTSLVDWLGNALAQSGPTGRIDCDPGQGRIAPPAAIGLGREPGASRRPEKMWFVGAVSPALHLLGMATGISRLATHAARLGLRRLVVDTPGFLDFPAGHAFHLRLVELLDLDHLVAVDGAGLSPVLDPLRRRRRPVIHTLAPSPHVQVRSRAARRAWRSQRFRRALAEARPWQVPDGLPLHGHLPKRDEDWPGRLVGLLDREGFLLRLGVAESPGPDGLRVRVAAVDAEDVSSLEVGTGRV